MHSILLLLVSLSAGTLFGGALLHLLPEAIGESGLTISISLLVLGGVVAFFVLEKFVHWHHCHVLPNDHAGSIHPHHIGLLNLIGDGLHNLIDGLVIAGSYFVSVPAGIATTVAVIIHEVPQELADFGVLLYSGFSKQKAILLNLLSALVAVVGAVVGLVLGSRSDAFVQFILPFAAGGFLYIAGANLIPELHKECSIKESMCHLGAMILGIALMAVLKFME